MYALYLGGNFFACENTTFIEWINKCNDSYNFPLSIRNQLFTVMLEEDKKPSLIYVSDQIAYLTIFMCMGLLPDT